jgi:[ribosomal protein S5]-alanine N-acetyltransferase
MEYQFKLKTCMVRPFRSGDADSIAHHANNRNVWINLRDAFPHPYYINDAIAFINIAMSIEPPTIFAIEKDNKAVGAIGFKVGKDVERLSAEIGYWLAETYWGQGVVTEGLMAVSKYAIDQFNLKRIFAVPFDWNPASFRVLEKAGYVLEGRMENSAIKDGKIISQLLYAYTV